MRHHAPEGGLTRQHAEPHGHDGGVRVVVVDPNLPLVATELEAALAVAVPGSTVAWHPRFDPAAVARDLRGAEVLVASRYTAALAPDSAALRLLQCPAAGVDGLDLDALPAGVGVARTGHHELAVAEHVLAGVVALRRRLREQDDALRGAGAWASPTYDSSLPLPLGLAGARIGFVGFGAIGSACWRAFAALGAVGAAVTGSGHVDADSGLSWAGRTDGSDGAGGLDRLVAESGVLVLCAPLVPATKGLLDARVLALAPRGAVVVNVARGPLVEEDALFDALASGHLGGAVLDVWWSYPRGSAAGTAATGAPGRRDWACLGGRVLASPHSSAITRQVLLARVADVAENARRTLVGEPLLNPVPR